MHCSKCGNKLVEGEVYCRRCGLELELVPIYSDLDDLVNSHIEKGLQEAMEEGAAARAPSASSGKDGSVKSDRSSTGGVSQEDRVKQAVRQDTPVPRSVAKNGSNGRTAGTAKKKSAAGRVILVILLCAGVIGFLVFAQISRKNGNSYEYQMSRAETYFIQSDYDKAVEFIERALQLVPADTRALRMQGEAWYYQGHYKKAAAVLEKAAAADLSQATLDLLFACYSASGTYEAAADFAEALEVPAFRSRYKEYRRIDPKFGLDGGHYDSPKNLQLMSEGGTIYYNLDGTEPDENSSRYEGSIYLEAGVYEVRAVVYNDFGVPGQIASMDYEIATEGPSMPAVSPSSGTFSGQVTIQIIVPEGCTAYYIYDDQEDTQPDESCSLYTGAVQMKSGSHIFKAVLIDSNGNKSPVTSRIYKLNE